MNENTTQRLPQNIAQIITKFKKLKNSISKINDPPHPGQGGSQGGKASWESPIYTNRIGFLKDSDGWLDFIGIRIRLLKDSFRNRQPARQPTTQPTIRPGGSGRVFYF